MRVPVIACLLAVLSLVLSLPAQAQAPKPENKPAAKPAAKPEAKPAPKPAEKPAAKPAEKPAAKPAEKPAANGTAEKQPPAEIAKASQATKDAYAAMPMAERLSIQSDLIWSGDYNGGVTGEFGDRAIAAVK